MKLDVTVMIASDTCILRDKCCIWLPMWPLNALRVASGTWVTPDAPPWRKLFVGTTLGNVTIFTLDPAELITLGQQRLTRTWTPEECRQYLQREMCPAQPYMRTVIKSDIKAIQPTCIS